MKQLTSTQIRRMYLDFFVEKGHKIEPSASLVPVDDPTLLWINSGVATLKKYFDGNIPEGTYQKILAYQVLWDYLWALWTCIKEAEGDDFGTYGLDRYNRAIQNLKLISIK